MKISTRLVALLIVGPMVVACSNPYEPVIIGDCTVEIRDSVIGLLSLTAIAIDGENVRFNGVQTDYDSWARWADWWRLTPQDRRDLVAEYKRCQGYARG